MRWISIFAVLSLLCYGSAHAQGNQCRTASVGASTANCASEAFVTESIGAIPPSSGVSSLNGQTGPVTLLTQPQGRLTLTANTPVMIATASAQTTLRYDCYAGNQVPYYTGSADAIDTISSCEVTDAMVSAASAGQVVSGQVYDVWWEGNSHHNICLAMSSSSGGGGGWASDTGGSKTSRGTGYTQIDGVTRPYTTNKNTVANCFNGSTNYGSIAANKVTYLGTIYASGNGQVSWTLGAAASGGSAALLGVWNMSNRVSFTTTVTDTNNGYSYSSATIRQADNNANNQISFVLGLQEDGLQLSGTCGFRVLGVPGATTQCGFGFDTITAFSSGPQWFSTNGNSIQQSGLGLSAVWNAGVGLHVVSKNEAGDGSNANLFNNYSNVTGTQHADFLAAQLRM